MTDQLERRLRTARPPTACVDEAAVDEELLARLRGQPIATRRTLPRAVVLPVAAGVTLTATAVLMLGGGPSGVGGPVGGPSSASAVTQALQWLNPPSGTILHDRSVETNGSQTITREFWQSSDDPASYRLRIEGEHAHEETGDALYDPATNTIYAAKDPRALGDGAAAKGADAKVGAKAAEPKVGTKIAGAIADATVSDAKAGTTAAEPKVGTAAPGEPDRANAGRGPDEAVAAPKTGDPVVAKARALLSEGQMVVSGPEVHHGTDAWEISLKQPDSGDAAWALWVSAADGRPLEVSGPGPDTIRWSSYEVLPDSDADQLLTLTGAHPSAQVVRDPAQAAAAEERLVGPEG